MPCTGLRTYLDRDKWDKCMSIIASQMIAQGWIKYAQKFRDVQKRRALKLYYA